MDLNASNIEDRSQKLTTLSSKIMSNPLQSVDMNKAIFPRPQLDTPPPSSPMADDSFRGHRSSSITLPLSSSPAPADHHEATVNPGASPHKPVRDDSRQNIGVSYAVSNAGDQADPFAGMEELKGAAEGGFTHVLFGSYSHALLLGRCKPSGDHHASSQGGSSDSIPPSTGIGAKPCQQVALPNTARHVSRRHAIVEWVPFSPAARPVDSRSKLTAPGGFVVRILGQNGLIVDGKRRREGHVLRLEPGKSTIDFFGVPTRFEMHPEARKPMALLSHAATQQRTKKARASFPGSDGSSPCKSSTGASFPKSSSLQNLYATQDVQAVDSQDVVSQMLVPGSKSEATQLPKKPSATTKPAQAPPSPPTSSPTPLGLRADTPESEVEDDKAPEEPLSPSLGRERALPPPQKRVRIQESAEEKPSLQLAKASTAANDSDDSDLTPPPTERTATALPRSRPFKATTSQTLMPPPKYPASAAQAAQSSGSSVSANATQSDSLRTTLRDRARSCVAQLAPTYDLEGLLAGAIVFHRTATISASEAVRSVLAGTQGLMRGEVGAGLPASSSLTHGSTISGWGARDLLVDTAKLSESAAAERWASMSRRAWTEQLETILQSRRMFGQIQRAGKDASGNSLECWYYYDKDGDEDRERAANLGSLVKPIRGALKTHKPIFWKKSSYPRSAEEEETASSTSASTSEVLTSKGDRLSSLRDGPMGDSQVGPALNMTPRNLVVTLKRDSRLQPSNDGSSHRSIDEKRIWEETQPEEREKTWDRVGDMDWGSSSSSSPSPMPGSGASASLASAAKRKRK